MPGIHPDFIQDGPAISDTFATDSLLKAFLKWKMPKEMYASIAADLSRFSARCAGEIHGIGEAAEAQLPRHVPFDPWGRRIDHIEVSTAWKTLDRISAEEGLVAIGYERKQGGLSRLYQFAKLFLFHPASAFYTCPLAMTDGAARVLELYGTEDLKAGAFRHLTSRDPMRFWTSGQWMTEKTGGSDVSSTSTIARPQGAGKFRLFGDKFFTSATTAQMTMALAKVEGATDKREGLSLFYAEIGEADGRPKNIRVHRLKDKLGTKALPTAELTMEGVEGVMVGGLGEGVKTVTSLLNITRLYNSVTALATMSRALGLAKDYALKREAFGRKLRDLPLHLETLARLQCAYEAVFALGFHLLHLLGKDETGEATHDESALLRLMTPILKLWSAKEAIQITSESIECIGGAGYMEDTGMPRLLRDAQVYAIWEGTTNVLSLDVLRAIGKENALQPYFSDVSSRLARVSSPQFSASVATLQEALAGLRAYAARMALAGPEAQQAGARDFAFALGRVFAASLLLEFAAWNETSGEHRRAADVARRFCATDLLGSLLSEAVDRASAEKIVYG